MAKLLRRLTRPLISPLMLPALGVLLIPGDGSTAAEIQYGRTAGYDAGTAGNWFVDPDGGSDLAAGTVGAPFATLGKAKTVLANGQTIRIKGDGKKVRENVTFTGFSNIRIASYGTDIPILTGGALITSWTQCDAGDLATVGANYASIYKKTLTVAGLLEHTAFHALLLTENGEPLDLVQRRHDTSYLFAQDDNEAFYSAANGDTLDITTNGSGYAETITHAAVLPTYTDAQLANCAVAIHADPNVVKVANVVSASSGVLTIDVGAAIEPETTGGDKYALLNILPAMQAGQWGYVDNGAGTFTLYVWPLSAGSLTAGIEIAARERCLTFEDCAGVEVDGFQFGMTSCSDDQQSPVYAEGCTGVDVHDVIARNISSASRGYGAVTFYDTSTSKVRKATIENCQNLFGVFLRGIGTDTGNRVLNVDFINVSQTPVRGYGQTYCVTADYRTTNCGFGAHANQWNWYLSSNWCVVLRGNFSGMDAGYGTNQTASNVYALHCRITMSGDGRCYSDQTFDDVAPPVVPSTNYLVNCFGEHWPSRAGATNTGFYVGSTPQQVNWQVLNCVAPGIVIRGGTLTAKNNVLTFDNSRTLDPSETEITDLETMFVDPDNGNFDTLPGSPLLGRTGYDVSSVIATLEATFPDIDFRRDLTGAVWSPADPGVGCYGKSNWPVAADAMAPVLSSLSSNITGTTADCSVTTNELGGTIYWVRLPDGATTPSAAQIKAGQDASGAAASATGNFAVGLTTGAKNFNVSGLPGTTYKLCVTQEDRFGNLASVVTASLAYTAYSPSWVAFNGTNWLRKTNEITGVQSSTQSFLIAVTHKRSNAQNVATTAGIMSFSTPSARSLVITYTTNHRLNAQLKRPDGTTIFNQLITTQTGADDVEFLTLYRGYNDGTNFRCQERVIRLSDGQVINATDITTSAADVLNFSGFSVHDIFKGAGSYERFMLWDNATADITNSTVRDLFYDNTAHVLKDPAVAVAGIGTPIVNFYASRLTSGVNAGSGGDWTFS